MNFTEYLDGTTLNMHHIHLANQDIQNLISFLQEHQDIKKLDLSYNNIGAEGAKALANSKNLANLTELDLSFNKIGAEGVEALAESPHQKHITIFLYGPYQAFYNFLIESSSKTGELYKNSVKKMVFAVAQNNRVETVIKHILKHPKKYPFLINSQDEQGRTLSHFYNNSSNMKKFLFEHGSIYYGKESEISPELMNKYQDHLEEKIKQEKQREVITAINIGEFEEDLAETLIQYVKEYPELKDALEDFAVAGVDIKNLKDITLEHQKILAKINQEFSKIKNYLPNYDRDIPTYQEYKIIIEELSVVKKMELFSQEMHNSSLEGAKVKSNHV